MNGTKKLGLAEGFLRSFGAVLSEQGFKRVPRRATFQRTTPEGWCGIHAPITRYMDGVIVVALTAIIRFDRVERLIVKLAGDAPYLDGPNRGTLAIFMTADVEQDRSAAFTIEQSGDVSNAVAWARMRCDVQASPFFERFPTLEGAYPALLTPPSGSNSYDFPFGHERAKRALAAAVVLKLHGDLGELVDSLRTTLAADPHALVSEFDDFARRVVGGRL